MTAPADPFALLIGKLNRLGPLDAADETAIRALPHRLASEPANHHLVREGARPTEVCLLLDGHACRYKTTRGGGRQIVSFHMPGDLLDLQQLMLPRADHDIVTISPARLAWFPASDIKRLQQNRPAINEALWRDTLIDASIYREWVLNVGRRDAKSRIAHMLCEFAARRQAAGLGGAERFELPMTQEQIADATGMTAVHVNRMLHALAAEGLIARDRRLVEIVDWNRMQRAADFDPAYLHAAA